MPAAVQAAREKLQDALDSLPEWHPDNSFFKGDADPALEE